MKEICLILQLCLLFVLLLLLPSPTFPSREAAPVGQTKKRTPGSAPVVCSLYVPFSPSEDEMGLRASVRGACVHIVLSLLLKWMPPPPPALHCCTSFVLFYCAAAPHQIQMSAPSLLSVTWTRTTCAAQAGALSGMWRRNERFHPIPPRCSLPLSNCA